MATKKIKYFISLAVLCLSYSCIPPIGNIDELEDSGYILKIRNFSEETYTGCTLYIGVINSTKDFIKIDSLVFDDLIVINRDEGTEVFDGKKYALIEPFDVYKQKLTKFSTWAPPPKDIIESISPEGKVSFKFLLHNGGPFGISEPQNGVGGITVIISENKLIEWR